MAKVFADDRAAKAQIPGQQRAGGAKMKGGVQTGPGARKKIASCGNHSSVERSASVRR